MEETDTPSLEASPQITGFGDLDDDDGDDANDAMSMVIFFLYHEARFNVLVSAREKHQPPSYQFGESVEGRILIELTALSYGEQTDEKERRGQSLRQELFKLAGDACLPLMQKLAPPRPPDKQRTLQEQLYPETYVLQVLTEDSILKSQQSDAYDKIPVPYPPIPESQLGDIGLDDTIPIVEASETLTQKRLQADVWEVTVQNETMICKLSMSHYPQAFVEELKAYVKFEAVKNRDQLRVPQLKGIIKSHKGVIGLLLAYIPHKHRSLRTLLDKVQDGTLPSTEATPSMRRKWAEQIKESLAQLHSLGILWKDVKTDNVLIDGDDNAVLLDFGGGNTVGWVDHDKYGTMEGEMQGLEKILVALGVA